MLSHLDESEFAQLEEAFECNGRDSRLWNLLQPIAQKEADKINAYRKSLINKLGNPDIGSEWELSDGDVVIIEEDREDDHPYSNGYYVKSNKDGNYRWVDFDMDGCCENSLSKKLK